MQLVEILDKLDNTNKNELENQIVSMGSSAVPVLVEQLQCSKGLKRGVVAMSLIRIGEEAISMLKEAADKATADDIKAKLEAEGAKVTLK